MYPYQRKFHILSTLSAWDSRADIFFKLLQVSMAGLRSTEAILERHRGCVSLPSDNSSCISVLTDSSAPPPGVSAPGTAPPPGMQQTNAQQPGRPGFPSNFQPPPNMPNINFNAPVIRLGTSGPSKSTTPEGGKERGGESGGRRAGLGSESQRQNARDAMMQLQPPTKEEIVRTIFVGGITEGTGGDEGVERILRSVGKLRRWIRATDADDKPCKFGFAEYEDPESLGTAVEVLKDVEVPVKRQMPSEDGDKEEREVEKSKLLVCLPK